MKKFRFTLLSDLHREHYTYDPREDNFEQYVIIAGDTANDLYGSTSYINKLKEIGYRVFAIPGNHEHYSNNIDQISPITLEDQFYLQINQTHVDLIDDTLMIIGETGWYNVPLSMEQYWKRFMNDSRMGNITISQVNEMAQSQAENLRNLLKSYPDRKAIVVTHMAPTMESLDSKYEGSGSNQFYWNIYLNDVLKEFSDRILVWCHGHTHASCDKLCDGVRVVVNPRGYPSENPTWEPVSVEVEYA